MPVLGGSDEQDAGNKGVFLTCSCVKFCSQENIGRKILTQLKNAGLINVIRGTGGIELTRDLKDITFYDVYQAIEPLEDGNLFRFHESPNPECPVGRNIHSLLDDKLKSIQEAMESEMKKYTLNDLRSGMQELLAKEA